MTGQGEERDVTGDAAAPMAVAPGEHGEAAQEPKTVTAPKPAAKLVFDDPLSRQTSDDTDSGWGESGAGRGLDWYLSQRPPHHGG